MIVRPLPPAAGLALAAAVLSPVAAPALELHERAWLLMGTAFEVRLYAPDSAAAVAGFDAAWRAAARVDSLMSLYRADSELSRLNREAFRRPVPVSAETFDVLAKARAFHDASGGAFDVTVKPAMDTWGFYRKQGHAPDAAACDSLSRLIDGTGVLLDRAALTVRYDREGLAVDLGGIAKGYALDEAARALAARGISAALLNLGGNILACGPPPGERGWPVGILDPRAPDSIAAILDLAGAAVSSSGGYEKWVVLDGVRYGHIVDPRTARPVAGVAGTTVVARDGITADALSTTLYVTGVTGLDDLARRPDVLGAWIAASGAGAPLRAAGILAEAAESRGDSHQGE